MLSGGRTAARRLWWGLGSGLLPLFLLVIFGAGAQAQVMECSSANADSSYTVLEGWALIPSSVGDKQQLPATVCRLDEVPARRDPYCHL